jgi:hypothetical protein
MDPQILKFAALKFEREDWTSFRTIEGLSQKAGVAKGMLPRLVLKELADNGLDAGAAVTVGELPNGYFIEDTGPGLDGAPEDIARLFSISRPLVSTKLLRLPTRGALGNGLRVVAGAVLASEGFLTVITRNRRISLRPERDGTTTVVGVEPAHQIGTRIEMCFGLPRDANALSWAQTAINLARGQTYSGKTSPWWYDAANFHELLDATGDKPVRELVAQLDGCSGGKAGEIVAGAGLSRATCSTVTRAQAEKLLRIARANARAPSPKRLGAIGPNLYRDMQAYACAYGNADFGAQDPLAKIPFVIEAWAYSERGAVKKTSLNASVNRTPVTGNIRASRDKRDIDVFGCGLHHTVASAPAETHFIIALNVIAPFVPITSDGKEPDLQPFLSEICRVIASAVRKARRPGAGSTSQKEIVLDNLDAIIADVSGGGEFRFNARQLFYALRPIVMQEIEEELKIGNFTSIITDYEEEHGEIAGMYREPRGSIYHPHRSETITLGTLMVEEYERPVWTYNKIVYIEKEGANEALKTVRWAERHDCAVISSKGYSTRAARDLIDKLADHDEPVTVFCVHDADAYGTMIYQTFQEATKARRARKIRIVNLGLEPWEDMGLEVEAVAASERRKPIANYVTERGPHWEEWLQTRRIELNAMTTPQFIAWLDAKMAEHGSGKLVPPAGVLMAELDRQIEQNVRATLTERILREAGLEDRIKTALAVIEKPSAAALAEGIVTSFEEQPDRQWRNHVEDVADEHSASAMRAA